MRTCLPLAISQTLRIAILDGGGHALAVGGEYGIINNFRVIREDTHTLSCGYVPDVKGFVFSGSKEILAVGREPRGVDCTAVAREDAQLFTRRKVPQGGSFVSGGGSQVLAVWGDGDAIHPGSMAHELAGRIGPGSGGRELYVGLWRVVDVERTDDKQGSQVVGAVRGDQAIDFSGQAQGVGMGQAGAGGLLISLGHF